MLNPAQTHWLERHPDRPPEQLAKETGASVRAVKAALKKLAKDQKVLALTATAEIVRADAPTPPEDQEAARLAEEVASLKEENKSLKKGRMRDTSVAMDGYESKKYDDAQKAVPHKAPRLASCIAIVNPDAPVH